MDSFETSFEVDETNQHTRYRIINRLGEGVHGIVLKAIDLTTNQLVAIKKIPLKTKHGAISLNAIREIKILQHSDCINVSYAIKYFMRILLIRKYNFEFIFLLFF